MNSFDVKFFGKYVPAGQDIKFIIHSHWISVLNKLILFISLGALIPSFLYFNSYRIQEYIPFIGFEIYLILVFIKIIYDIFDWYNDVWIITDKGVVDLEWALFKTDMKTVNYENIEGVQVEQNSVWDKVLRKGDLVVHKIGDDAFVLENARKPYVGVDKIEEFKTDQLMYEDDENDRFDIVMDALSGVVRDYLGNNGLSSEQGSDTEEEFKKDLITKIKSKDGTVDLR